MARTLQQRLDDVDQAMKDIETGAQAYTTRTREWEGAKYEKLAEERARLQAKVDEQARTGSSMSSVIQVSHPS